MSAEILIEGLSPNSLIGPGERRRVQAGALVNTLIRNGFAKVIHEATAAVEEPVEPAPAPAPRRKRKAPVEEPVEP